MTKEEGRKIFEALKLIKKHCNENKCTAACLFYHEENYKSYCDFDEYPFNWELETEEKGKA